MILVKLNIIDVKQQVKIPYDNMFNILSQYYDYNISNNQMHFNQLEMMKQQINKNNNLKNNNLNNKNKYNENVV